MRMLLAIPSLRAGGAERAMSTLASHWVAQGHDVALATFEPPDGDFFEIDARVVRYVVGDTRHAMRGAEWLTANLRRVRAFRRVLRETEPDIVLSLLHTMNLVTLLAVRGAAPVIVMEQTDPRNYPVERWQTALRRLLYRRAAGVVVLSEEIRSSWGLKLAPPSRVFTVPNVALRAARREWRGEELPDRFVVSAGRLVPSKGFDVLLRAFARIAGAAHGWSLVLLGDGPERQPLERLAADLGLGDRVVFTGLADTDAGFSRASVFALATRTEGFPMVVVEAMAHGLPVICTDCGPGPREIIRPGVDGLLVPVDDVDAIGAAIAQLIDDEPLRTRLGAAATEIVDRYGIERVSSEWERVFACATANWRSSKR
jgi:GalNAc-alpha-(1->4)-GalNAc-alpha-(1->3)-diNAcBac-PP-undecaprenol alpha-1,4-N-acetyl-D-galactosaminyltransferase